jgi:predicted RNA-binding Zn ribbon-like protein
MHRLWIEFLNSDWHDPLGRGADQDRLNEPGWLVAFLDQWGLPRIQPATHRRSLKKLRELLRRLATTLHERGALGSAELSALNRYLGARPIRPRLSRAGKGRYRIELVPGRKGIDALLLAIATSFAQFLVEEDPARLKMCDNPDCKWVFYDTTRSRTRRWCAASCGNLMKVRKYRRRHAQRRRGRAVM